MEFLNWSKTVFKVLMVNFTLIIRTSIIPDPSVGKELIDPLTRLQYPLTTQMHGSDKIKQSKIH